MDFDQPESSFTFTGEMWFLKDADNQTLMVETGKGSAIVLCGNADDAFAMKEAAGNGFEPYRFIEPEDAANLLDSLRPSGLKFVAHKVPEGYQTCRVEIVIGKLLNQ